MRGIRPNQSQELLQEWVPSSRAKQRVIPVQPHPLIPIGQPGAVIARESAKCQCSTAKVRRPTNETRTHPTKQPLVNFEEWRQQWSNSRNKRTHGVATTNHIGYTDQSKRANRQARPPAIPVPSITTSRGLFVPDYPEESEEKLTLAWLLLSKGISTTSVEPREQLLHSCAASLVRVPLRVANHAIMQRLFFRFGTKNIVVNSLPSSGRSRSHVYSRCYTILRASAPIWRQRSGSAISVA